MKQLLHRADEFDRRRFISSTAKSLLGVALAPTLAPLPMMAAESNSRRRAKKVIYLYMSGGMSHLDTFDPKPDTEEAGPVKAIPTTADDVFLSEYMSAMASQMDKVAVVRGMSTNQGAHEQGNYLMHSSYQMRGTITHPGLGAWIHRLDGKTSRTLPASVRIGGGSRGAGAGFLESKYSPLVLSNPNEGLKNSRRADGISPKEFNDRLMLSEAFDREFHQTYNQKKVRAYQDMYDDALRLMRSEDLKAFDLGQEDSEVREAYGDNSFGQGCLLARRLVENDVRFVEVTLGGWDTHSNNFTSVAQRAAVLDQALANLLIDLERRGMLDETLVVLATEFGRTPRINQNEGRDHFPKAFSCLLAGGGIRGGQAWGKTDKTGSNILEHKVMVPDFNATIAYALGLPYEEEIYSASKRPFKVANNGQPVTGLF